MLHSRDHEEANEVCRTDAYGALNLGIVVDRVPWRTLRIALPVIQDELAAALDDVACASTQRQCIEDSLQLRRINRHQGTLPCEMFSRARRAAAIQQRISCMRHQPFALILVSEASIGIRIECSTGTLRFGRNKRGMCAYIACQRENCLPISTQATERLWLEALGLWEASPSSRPNQVSRFKVSRRVIRYHHSIRAFSTSTLNCADIFSRQRNCE